MKRFLFTVGESVPMANEIFGLRRDNGLSRNFVSGVSQTPRSFAVAWLEEQSLMKLNKAKTKIYLETHLTLISLGFSRVS